MADESTESDILQPNSSLTGDTLCSQDLSKSKTISSEESVVNSVKDSKQIVRSKIPNGVVTYESANSTVNCNSKELNHNSLSEDNEHSVSEQPSSFSVQASNTRDHGYRKQNDLTDSADSGVHSGTDNGSDAKSASSSPGLSTESSVQDLCEKTAELKKYDAHLHDKTQDLSVKDVIVNELALSMESKARMSQRECDSETRDLENGIEYVVYESELQMPDIMRLITKDLSEPYSIYTYRYFIHNWPKLCFLAMEGSNCVGAIVCKLDMHKKMVRRGYIAMLAVDQSCRRKGIGSHLVLKAIRAMIRDDCDEVVLETEITNKAALRLYENLGFVRDKRLFRYYLNGVDALRLKLWLR